MPEITIDNAEQRLAEIEQSLVHDASVPLNATFHSAYHGQVATVRDLTAFSRMLMAELARTEDIYVNIERENIALKASLAAANERIAELEAVVPIPCTYCDGTGQVKTEDLMRVEQCAFCEGTGRDEAAEAARKENEKS